ncbi:MAG: polymer-forming cytoskeletal protein [Parcubacteria group bacterium]|nr:polymer-forming cytoskeletal protein [Parcubacteria group bacterium]
MFNYLSQLNGNNKETILGPSVKFEGNIIGKDGDIKIEGMITGSIKTKHSLYILRGAKVDAIIKAASALIDGEAHGNIKIDEHLDLGETARVVGNIIARRLTVANGALIDSKIAISGDLQSIPQTQL